MPRRVRVFVSGAVYHVYCRVARGEPVFSEAREAAALVGVIHEVTREHSLTVLAWCVMATHYHLAVRVGRVPLWRSMRLIQGRFARSYNRRHRLLGPFWQGRYKAIVVPDQRYLQQLIAYIHLNPVTAKKVVTDPARYRWSGHGELLGSASHQSSCGMVTYGSPKGSTRHSTWRTSRPQARNTRPNLRGCSRCAPRSAPHNAPAAQPLTVLRSCQWVEPFFRRLCVT